MKSVHPTVIAIAIVGAGLALLLVACETGRDGMHGRRDGRTTFASNGERIYFTGESESGEPIRARGGSGSGWMMGELACVDCHGEDGEGGRVTMMMETFSDPDITWHELGAEEHHADGEEDHPPYTAETLKVAITRGINPAGERLSNNMPRWDISVDDLDDLVAYLMTLGQEQVE